VLAATAVGLTLPQSEQARTMLLVHFSTWFHREKAAAVALRSMLFGNAKAAAAADHAVRLMARARAPSFSFALCGFN